MKESLGKGKLAVLLAGIAVVVYVAWQVGSCEVANLQLRDDLQDLAAQVGTKIGLDAIRTDAEIRAMAIRRAEDHGIELKPEQVSVERTGSGDQEIVRLVVDYEAQVRLLAYSFRLHFTPSSGGR